MINAKKAIELSKKSRADSLKIEREKARRYFEELPLKVSDCIDEMIRTGSQLTSIRVLTIAEDACLAILRDAGYSTRVFSRDSLRREYLQETGMFISCTPDGKEDYAFLPDKWNEE